MSSSPAAAHSLHLHLQVKQKEPLPQHWFAEGVTRLGDHLYQLAWQTGTIFKWAIKDGVMSKVRASAAAVSSRAPFVRPQRDLQPPRAVASLAQGTALDGCALQLVATHPLHVWRALPAPILSQVAELQGPLSDGWGLTTDGKLLIATDSSAVVSFIDPDSLKVCVCGERAPHRARLPSIRRASMRLAPTPPLRVAPRPKRARGVARRLRAGW